MPAMAILPSPRARRARLRLACAGAVLGLLGAGIAAEAWVRLTQPYATPATERQRSWRYQAALLARSVLPQMEQARREPAQRINARGYRGPPFAVPKPAGVRRVVVLGGSAAFDIHAADGADWPRQLEGRLRALGHADVEVINAGVPGNATWDMLGRLAGEIWMFEPDLVVFYEAWNDIKAFGTITPEHSLLRTVAPPKTIKADGVLLVWNPFIEYGGRVDRWLCHSQLYVRLRTGFLRWRLGKLGPEGRQPPEGAALTQVPPWGPRQYELDLHLLAAAARAAGALPVLLTQARLAAPDNGAAARGRLGYDYVGLSHAALLDAFAACDAAVRRVSASARVPMLDVSARLSGRPELFVDHVHTTPAGSTALADAVAEFLAPLLAAPAGQRPAGAPRADDP